MDAYLFLAASLVPLALGPPIARWAERSGAATATLDAFVAVTVGGISLLHVLPHAYAAAGSPTLVALALGFVLPLGLGHHHGGGPRRKRPVVVLVAFLGLGLHATLDGLALFGPGAEPPDRVAAAAEAEPRPAVPAHLPVPGAQDPGHDHRQGNASLLAAAVILHRLPMALAIWWIAVPSLGRRIALGLLAMIGAATLAGFALGSQIWGWLSSPGLAVLQAAIAGMLLHMVLGHHEHPSDGPMPRSSRAISTLGVLAGVALLAAMTRLHPFEHRLAGELSTGATFLALTYQAAPALLLSYLGIAVFYGFAPAGLPGPWLGSPREAPAGAGRSPTISSALLVLRPEIQLPVLALSSTLLGPSLAAWRLLAVLAVAGLAALSIRALLEAVRGPDDAGSTEQQPAAPRASAPPPPGWKAGLRFGFGAAFDRTAPWILLGLGVAAFLEPMTGFVDVRTASEPARIALLAMLGVPLYLLGLGATPIVAVLAHKGVGSAGLLAFLLTGAAVSGGRRLRAAFGGRVAWGFGVRMIVLAWVAAYALDVPVSGPDLHDTAARDPGPLELLSCLGLLALTVASVFRQGFRRFLRPSVAMERWHGAGL